MRRVNHEYDLEPSIAHKYNAMVMEEHIKPMGKVLDVGCWTGQLYLALPFMKYRYTGIDIAQEAVSLARKKHKRAVWRVLDAKRLPLAKGSFDAVVMFEVLEHLGNDEQQCIVAIARVLKKGGILILSTPAHNLLSILSDPAYFLQNHNHYKEAELKQFLKNDFVIQKIWLKGHVIYVSMYLTQMFFKHIFKVAIPSFMQKLWEKSALKEFKNKDGFLGYYLVAKRK